MAGTKVAKSALEALRAALARSMEPRQAYGVVPARPPEPSPPPSRGQRTDPDFGVPPRPLPEAPGPAPVDALLNSPMSRRGFMRAAGAQAVQRMLPQGMSASPLNTVGEIARQAVAKQPFSVDDVIPGLVARAIKSGVPDEQVEDYVLRNIRGMVGAPGVDVYTMHSLMKYPYDASEQLAESVGPGPTRLRVLQDIYGANPEASPYAIRPRLRGVKTEDPNRYEELRQMARDIVDYGYEE